ncbi:hypothetical protein [Paraburkholderia sediminicola]|uniref:hypothetical protein n=1 Tax=Paraburkholderia sediminicola TaxID=458836 RepID=UPI0038B934B7
MATNDEIDFTLFNPKTLKQAVAALKDQPPLDRYKILRNDQAFQVTKAQLQEIWSIYLPLSEAYIGVRRKLDKKYVSETDPVFEQLRKKVSPRTDKLLDELEKYHAIRMRVSAARVARTQIYAMLEEVEKIIDLLKHSMDIEKSSYLPPSVDTGNH